MEVEDAQSSDAALWEAWRGRRDKESLNQGDTKPRSAVLFRSDGQGIRRASSRTPNCKPSASPFFCFCALGVRPTDGPPLADTVVPPFFLPLFRTSNLADPQDRGRWAVPTDFLWWWPSPF